MDFNKIKEMGLEYAEKGKNAALDLAEKGKEPERAFKGSFNVRTGSELHKQAALAAAKKGESLNKFVTEAIAAAL